MRERKRERERERERERLSGKEENGRDEPIQDIVHIYMEMS
jgi:hypothetical protein